MRVRPQQNIPQQANRLPGDVGLCPNPPGALPRDPTAFWKRRAKTSFWVGLYPTHQGLCPWTPNRATPVSNTSAGAMKALSSFRFCKNGAVCILLILTNDNIFLRAAARIKSIISAASPGKLYKSEKSTVQTGLSCRSAAIHLLSAGRAFRSGTR